MLEPSARYSAGGVGGGGGGAGQTLQIDTHHSGLETAVDLSRKTEATGGDLDADQEDSEDDAPLDLKVCSTEFHSTFENICDTFRMGKFYILSYAIKI